MKIFFLLIGIFISLCPAQLPAIEFGSTRNPVGAGSRGNGMGGSHLSIADESCGMSWNSGAIIQQEELFELSIATLIYSRLEKISMGDNPAGNGNNNVSDITFSYVGIVSTFEQLGKNMSVGISYQHLYDLNRHLRFPYEENGFAIRRENWSYEQRGNLSTVGLTYCIELIRPSLSFGLTFNFWKDSLSPNQWTQYYKMNGNVEYGATQLTLDHQKTEEYTFDGYNMNFGLLWHVNYKLSLGAVLKTPFNADIEHKIYGRHIELNHTTSETRITPIEEKIYNEQLKMPLSYGIGMVYRWTDLFYISLDIHKTHWNNYIYTYDNGNQTSAVSNKNISESGIRPTHQVRMGCEYMIINKYKKTAIPIRAGLFYDPAPAEKNPDDYYGFSLGTGYIKNDIGSIDIAYVYRFGNNVGASMLEDVDFSENIQEHMVHVSLVSYFY